jgi:colanic acid biosynthesis glycosyl transferase WcaI
VPYYPEWRVADAYRRRPFARERRNGVDIRRCPIYVPSGVTPLRRMVHEATFVLMALLRSLTCRRPDVVFVVSPPLGLAAVAWILSRLWRVPYVFHVADLQPDTALDLGMVRNGPLVRVLYALEQLAYRGAALVSTLSPQMRDRIVAKGLPPEKVTLFADWADPELFDLEEAGEAPAASSIRTELGLGDAFLVLHAGNMGVKQGLDVVLDAAARTREDGRLIYLLVGDGAVRPALEARAHAMGLSNVRFVPLLPRPAFLRLLAAADVCLVTQQRTVADIVFPSKVLTLLAAGKPVIASVTAASAVARAIADAGAGDVVEPENPAALADAVRVLRDDAVRRRAMSVAGRAYARAAWERDATLGHLERMLCTT